MISCLVELFGIDGASSYNHAFTYLRAVAVGLRTALVSGSDSSSGAVAAARAAVASVASWATVNALRALTAIVCAHGATPSAPLWELVYPLAQVLSGLPRAAPAPSHYPLRLHMAALQNELQWATGVYVPVALPLLDILRCRALTLKPRGAAPSKPTPLSLIVRVAPSAADTKSYQDSLVARVLELILDATRSFFASPALPELVAPIVVQLRIFAADTRVPPWKSRARALIDTLVGASTAVSTRRATLPFTPTDTAALANFMSKEASALRLARSQAQSAAIAAEINAARLEALNPKPASTTAREGARNGGSDDDDDDDDEEGDDDNGNDASDDDDSASDNQEASGDDEDEDGSDEEDEDAGEETEASRPRAPPTFKSLKAKGSDSRGRFKILPRAASTLGEDVVGDIDAF
jgi:nucleolar complex protein 2